MSPVEKDDEGRRVPAEATYAAWFASSVEAVVAAVATTTRRAASSAPAASIQVSAEMVHAEVVASGLGRSGGRGDEDDGSCGNSGNGKSGLGG